MLQRILVPVDGSPLSERAFAIAETLARGHGAELVVARVVPPLAWFSGLGSYVAPEVYEDVAEAMNQEGSGYLAATAARLRAEGAIVRTEMLHGPAAAALLDFEATLHPDIVVMSTHGRTGMARFALGSTADTMVREGTAPVLVVRAFSAALSSVDRALVPLDGSPAAEAALPMVETLAGNPLLEIQLLRAIADEAEREEAGSYLDDIAARLSRLGVEVATCVKHDTASHAIHQAAGGRDLIILSTHGRGGVQRLRHGSVAERAARNLNTPTLLVRSTHAG